MTALVKIQGTWDFIIEVLEINAIRAENDHHASFSSLFDRMRFPSLRAEKSYHASVSIAIRKISVLIGLIGSTPASTSNRNTAHTLTGFLPHKSNIQRNRFEKQKPNI